MQILRWYIEKLDHGISTLKGFTILYTAFLSIPGVIHDLFSLIITKVPKLVILFSNCLFHATQWEFLMGSLISTISIP